MSADLAIIGAGPAGLAAACTAGELGLRTVVIDEQAEAGGQIYRGVERVAAMRTAHIALLGEDYAEGLALVRRFRAAKVDYLPRTAAWQIDRDLTLHVRGPEGIKNIALNQILISTGAMERPMPVPGWTLPGVMTCGAAQILLKSAGLAPEGRVVLAGAGPMLYLIASQLARAGAPPALVLETETQWKSALRHAPNFLLAPGYLSKGLSMIGTLRAAGVPLRRGVADLRLLGDARVERVAYRWKKKMREDPADLVLLHQGVVPELNLASSLRCDYAWDDRARCFRPRLDPWGASSVAGVSIAGDAGGIIGAKASELSGAIAALGIAQLLGRIGAEERDRRAAPLRAEIRRHLRVRPFLDAYYRPAQEWVAPRDPDTIVCRCEEVRAGEIRELVTVQNCPGPNQMKAFTRCGMGPCQGRLCGLTVTELIAETRGVPQQEAGYYRIRPPVKPVSVGDLAGIRQG